MTHVPKYKCSKAYAGICVCVKLIDVVYLFIAPSEPCSLKLATVTSTSVTLKWMPPKYPNGIILKYSIEYDGNSIEKFGDEVSDQMTGTIEGLSPYTVYILDMKASTGVGAGPPACFTWKTRKLLHITSLFLFKCTIYIYIYLL